MGSGGEKGRDAKQPAPMQPCTPEPAPCASLKKMLAPLEQPVVEATRHAPADAAAVATTTASDNNFSQLDNHPQAP